MQVKVYEQHGKSELSVSFGYLAFGVGTCKLSCMDAVLFCCFYSKSSQSLTLIHASFRVLDMPNEDQCQTSKNGFPDNIQLLNFQVTNTSNSMLLDIN